MNYVVYMVRCKDGTLYTGSTNNLFRRIAQHNDGAGARYTRGRGPVEVAYVEHCASRSEALRREAAIKKLHRPAKAALIAAWRPTDLG